MPDEGIQMLQSRPPDDVVAGPADGEDEDDEEAMEGADIRSALHRGRDGGREYQRGWC